MRAIDTLHRALFGTRTRRWNTAALALLIGWRIAALLPFPRLFESLSVWAIPIIVIGCLIIAGASADEPTDSDAQECHPNQNSDS